MIKSETCDKLSALCGAALGIATCGGSLVAGGIAAGSLLLLVPGLRKMMRGKPTFETVLADVSKEIEREFQLLARSGEYKADAVERAGPAIDDLMPKINPSPEMYIEFNQDLEAVADQLVADAGEAVASEFGLQKPSDQIHTNRKILKRLLSKALAHFSKTEEYAKAIETLFQKEVIAFVRKSALDQQRIIDGIAELDEKVDANTELTREVHAMVSHLSAELANTAKQAGIQEQALINLAKRVTDDVSDSGQALVELESAVERLIRLQNRKGSAANMDTLIDEVIREMAALSARGKNDEASLEADRAMEAWHERQEREKAAALALLDAALETDLLRRDAEKAAQRIVEKCQIEFKDQQSIFDQVLGLQNEWFAEGQRLPTQIEMQVAHQLAILMIDLAPSAEDRAGAQMNRAVALRNLGERAGGEDGLAFLQEAVSAYDLCLEVRTRETMPADWATVQMNRANALLSLGQRAGGEDGLKFMQEAVSAYDLCLEVWTRETMPADWATVQMNRANALLSLGQRAGGEDGLAFMQEAVSAYDLCLEVRTRETMPADWATVQMNRAIALRNLGQRAGGEDGLAFLQEAVSAYDLCLEVWTRETMPADWATVQMNRANALSSLGQRAGGEDGLAFLQEALSAYDLCLEVWTRETMPAGWATVQMNRANALLSLGQRAGSEEGLAFLQEAVSAYDLCLEVWTRETMPADWAYAMENKANALGTLGENIGGMEGIAHLENALEHYDLALEVFDEPGMEYYAEKARNNRAIDATTLERLKGELG